MTTTHPKMDGPVYKAQYAFAYENGNQASNPYKVGTQDHATFFEQMYRLEKARNEAFDAEKPYGQALSDFIEGKNCNPYAAGTEGYAEYDLTMTGLIDDSKSK